MGVGGAALSGKAEVQRVTDSEFLAIDLRQRTRALSSWRFPKTKNTVAARTTILVVLIFGRRTPLRDPRRL